MVDKQPDGTLSRVRQFLAGGMAALGTVAMMGADSPQQVGLEDYLQSLDGEQEIVLTEEDTPRGLVDGQNDLAVAKGENPGTGVEGYLIAYRTPSGNIQVEFAEELYIGDISENHMHDYQFVLEGDEYSTPVFRVNEGYAKDSRIPTPVVERLNLYTFDEYLDGQKIRQPENTEKQISGL